MSDIISDILSELLTLDIIPLLSTTDAVSLISFTMDVRFNRRLIRFLNSKDDNEIQFISEYIDLISYFYEKVQQYNPHDDTERYREELKEAIERKDDPAYLSRLLYSNAIITFKLVRQLVECGYYQQYVLNEFRFIYLRQEYRKIERLDSDNQDYLCTLSYFIDGRY